MSKNLLPARKLLGAAVILSSLLAGCGDSENFVFTNTGTPNTPPPPAQSAPLAQDDAFGSLGNATLNQAAPGVLGNDTLNGAEISEFDSTGDQGGTLTLNQDGSFVYTPATDYVGPEIFSYTLSNSEGSSTAEVTLTSTGSGIFVDNSAPDGGTGTQGEPFDTLGEAVAIAQSGDIIYVSQGDGTNDGMTGGFTLPEGVSLVGEGTGLILGQTIEPAGQAPTLEGPVVCQGDNLIQGVTIDGSNGVLIEIDGVSNITVTQCTLADPANEFIEVDDVSGTLSITNNSFENPSGTSADYIEIANNGELIATADISDNTFLNSLSEAVGTLCDIDTGGGGSFDLTFSRNIADGTEEEQFSGGLAWENYSELTVGTVTCEDNLFNRLNDFDEAIALRGVGGTIAGNTISNGADYGIAATVEDQSLIISGNIMTNVGNGVELLFDTNFIDPDAGDSGSVTIVNNNITATMRGVFVESRGDLNAALALRDNTVNSDDTFIPSYGFEVDWDAATDICVEVAGNTFNDDLFFDGSGTGFVNIERRDQLTSINTIAGTVDFGNNTASVEQGACQIP